MHSLIITAHPSTTGFTHTIAAEYAQTKKELGATVTTMNLYDTEWKTDFLTFDSERMLKQGTQELNKAQQEIQNADEIVFVFPIWWSDTPAIIKNFLDTNFTAGFAFNYSKKGITGLLTGKNARFFSTCGAPSFVYSLGLMPYAKCFKFALKSCGFKINKPLIYGNRRGNAPELEAQFLQKVKKIASLAV